MKRCPQCNSLFEDAVQFCLNDGTPLVEEKFTLPSDEEETIIRHDPITINIPSTNEKFLPHQPAAENIVVVPAETNRNYALFLIVGLLLGGGLVLATFLLTKNYFQSSGNNSRQTTVNTNQAISVVTPKPTVEIANTNAGINTNADVIASETPSAKHAAPNDDANDGLFNGRVISVNARIRRDPSSTAPIVDVLPAGDRLDIIDRAAPKSPWYQVECEHGTTGWMHGDTIEFTKGNF